MDAPTARDNHSPKTPRPGAGEPTICAVVPFLDEEERLAGILEQLSEQPGEQLGRHRIDEIVAVDGGSRDRSLEIARKHADRVLSASGGLASQLNLGARDTEAEILFFVYADSILPADFRRTITETLCDPGCVGGAFPLALDEERLLYRLIAFGANLRTRLGLGPFGDQGLFVRRSAFQEIGGYRPQPILEDFDLVARLRTLGSFRIAGSPLRSSTRRWREHGVLKTTAHHWWALGRHLTGKHRAASNGCALDRVRTGGRSRSTP